MKKAILVSLVTLVCFSSSIVEAQVFYNRVSPNGTVVPTLPTYPYPYPYPYPHRWYPHDPGNLRGRAALIRAQAESRRAWSQIERNRAEIRKHNAEARDRELDNQRKQIEYRNALKQQYRAKREAEFAKRREARDRYLQSQRAKVKTTAKGTQQALAADDATINWPEVLRQDEYRTYRQRMDALVHSRTQAENAERFNESISATTRAMKARLKQNIRGMSANDYLAARKFIDTLTTTAGL